MPALLHFLLLLTLSSRDVAPDQAPAAPPASAARGLALMTNFRDSLPRHSGNGLRCVSCHLDNGTRATSMPWTGTVARYPRFRARPGYDETIERRINECIARSLAGKMLPEAGRDMRDMVAYLERLRTAPRAAGVDSVKVAGRPTRGRAVYSTTCARCHGPSGQGMPTGPALWGAESFSIGAGMARQFTFATFVRHNMPFDHAVSLTNQQAADVASFVLQQARQDHPGKERDWPKGDAPSDVAYATAGMRAAGKPLPPVRPLLKRRVSPDSLGK
jgi:thiosulfate dehydrogenase